MVGLKGDRDNFRLVFLGCRGSLKLRYRRVVFVEEMVLGFLVVEGL